MKASVKTYEIFANQIRKLPLLFVVVLLFLGTGTQTVQAYENVTIVIDPGHGGPGISDESDLGAVYHDVLEKDMTLTTALSLKSELEQYGNVTVYLTRAEDKKMTLKERVDYAAALGADVLISVHYNASAAHRFYGAEVFTSAFGQNYATGYGLAQSIMKRWTAEGAADKGIKTRIGNSGTDYYGLIRHGTAVGLPTIILEHGYIDHDIDWKRIGNEEAWCHLGQVDALGIADYFGLKKDVVQVSVAPQVVIPIPSETMSPDLTPPENVKLSIDQYDASTNEVSLTISAMETESRLMYYGIATEQEVTDPQTSFMELRLWEGEKKSLTATYTVPDGYEGALVFRAYNNYELYTDSEPVELSLDMAVNQPKKEEAISESLSLAHGENAAQGVVSGSSAQQADGAKQAGDAEQSEQTEPIQNKESTSGALIETKTGDSRRKALFGLIAAATAAVLALVAAIAITISANRRKRHKKHSR